MANMHQLLKAMIEKGASDLHITTGTPPQLRIDGKLHPLRMPPLTTSETKQLCYSLLTDAQKHRFEEVSELDLSFSVQKLSRFRANVFIQRGNVAGAFRAIPFKIKSFDELELPKVVEQLADRPRGLILVTGPTGSGKSTTLATIIDRINTQRNEHIVTIEGQTAYHESGHALVASLTPGSDPVHKVTIIPRGMALGVTLTMPEEDRYSMTKEQILAHIRHAMGGRAAEQLVFGVFTTGAANDLKQATESARRMVCEYGMGENIGPVSLGEEGAF